MGQVLCLVGRACGAGQGQSGEDLVVFRAQRLRAARLAAGLSQVQLATAIGTTRHEVGRWERGEFVPRPQMIPAVAAVVGLDPLELLDVDPVAPRLEDLRLASGLSLEALSPDGVDDLPRLGVGHGSA